MSIRLRLTLLYSGLLALTLIVLGVVLIVTISRVTFSTIESALAAEAQSLIRAQSGSISITSATITRRIAAPETYVQARGPDGAILAPHVQPG